MKPQGLKRRSTTEGTRLRTTEIEEFKPTVVINNSDGRPSTPESERHSHNDEVSVAGISRGERIFVVYLSTNQGEVSEAANS